jgi:hypothetical protein
MDDGADGGGGSVSRGPSRKKKRRGVVPSPLLLGIRVRLLNPDGAIAPSTIEARWARFGWFEDGTNLGDPNDWGLVDIGGRSGEYRSLSASSASRSFLGTISLLPGDPSLPVDDDFVRNCFFQVPAEGLLPRPPTLIFFNTSLTVHWSEILKRDSETLDDALVREGIKLPDVLHRHGPPTPATGGEIWGVSHLGYDFGFGPNDVYVSYD